MEGKRGAFVCPFLTKRGSATNYSYKCGKLGAKKWPKRNGGNGGETTPINGVITWVVATQTFFMFTPKIGEDDPIWLEHIFQMGWFNHQLVTLEVDGTGVFFIGANDVPTKSWFKVFKNFRLFVTSQIEVWPKDNWKSIWFRDWMVFREPPQKVSTCLVSIFQHILFYHEFHHHQITIWELDFELCVKLPKKQI